MVGVGKFNIPNKIDSLPLFARDEMKGKVSSQFGTRQKFERHLLKSSGGHRRPAEAGEAFSSSRMKAMTPGLEEPQMNNFV